MQSVIGREDRLTLFADLAKRVPGSSFDDFFLCGLPHILQLDERDWRALYALLNGHDIGIYTLTRFLIFYGRASKRVLQRLCENFSEIEQVDQFRIALEDDSPPSDPGKINSERGRQRVYKERNVPIEYVSRLEDKFGDDR
jgi:hypothetical protein